MRRCQGEAMTVPQWPFQLVAWFKRGHRPMPWRSAPTPYKVWVSEIMLQQTRVATAMPYFDRFMAAFPDVASLAAAPLESVLLLWEGLGYYSRARNLHKAAQHMVERNDGAVPSTSAELLRLPGIGPYTAAAIASIAFGEAVPAIDGNVLRVLTRLWGIPTPVRDPVTVTTIRKRLMPMIRHVDPSAFNQGLMETGALVCLPRRPRCDACVLAEACFARRTGRTSELPAKTRPRSIPHHPVVAVAVHKHGRVLIVKQTGGRMLEGLWEFPKVRRRSRETSQAAIGRVLKQAGVRAISRPLVAFRHSYSHFSITVQAFRCDWISGRLTRLPRGERQWCRVKDLAAVPMSRVSRRIGDALAGMRRSVPLRRLSTGIGLRD